MFTVKFVSYKGEVNQTSSFSCPHYTSEETERGWLIHISKDFVNTEFTTIEVSKDEYGYNACYVENQSGKTIDAFRA